MTRVAALVEAGVDIIAVDSAHGHSKGVLDKITEIRNAFPDLDIVGGNIVTADAAGWLSVQTLGLLAAAVLLLIVFT